MVEVVGTIGINNRIAESKSFDEHVIDSMEKFTNKDWGTLCDEDKRANDQAVINKDRVLASYGEGDNNIWIIKDAGIGANVTILFPDEN